MTTFDEVTTAIQALDADELEGFTLFLDRQLEALGDVSSAASVPPFEALAAISRGGLLFTEPLEPLDDSMLRLLGQAALKLRRSAEYVDIAADLADGGPGLGDMLLGRVKQPGVASPAGQDVWHAVLIAVRNEQNRRWKVARRSMTPGLAETVGNDQVGG